MEPAEWNARRRRALVQAFVSMLLAFLIFIGSVAAAIQMSDHRLFFAFSLGMIGMSGILGTASAAMWLSIVLRTRERNL